MRFCFKWMTLILFVGLSTSLVQGSALRLCAKGLRQTAGTKSWYSDLNKGQIEKTLKSGKIIEIQDMRDVLSAQGKKPSGSTGACLVTFENGVRGVWKPEGGLHAAAEVGMYLSDRDRGGHLVPPTVYRTLPTRLPEGGLSSKKRNAIAGKSGSLQYYVESPFDLSDPHVFQEVSPKISAKDKSDLALLHLIFGQWDRKPANLVVDENYSPVAIDNAAITHRQKVRFGELPFIRKIPLKRGRRKKDPNEFPFDRAILVKNPTKAAFKKILGSCCEDADIDNYWRRIDKPSIRNRTMAIVIWKDGVWIQSIGFLNYGPIVPEVYSQATLDGYAKMTAAKLEKWFPLFSKEQIAEILERRDMVLKEAQGKPRIP